MIHNVKNCIAIIEEAIENKQVDRSPAEFIISLLENNITWKPKRNTKKVLTSETIGI